MSHLALIQKAAQKRFALLEAQYSNAKAYRGVAYDRFIVNQPSVAREMTYRGVKHFG